MTDAREALDRIKARAEAATPGPWEAHGSTVAGITGTGDCGGCSGILSPAHEPSCYWSQIAEAGAEDTEFIAHARTDVDRLTEALEAVLSVAGELDRGAETLYEVSFPGSAHHLQAQQAEAAAARVRAAIEAKLSEEES